MQWRAGPELRLRASAQSASGPCTACSVTRRLHCAGGRAATRRPFDRPVVLLPASNCAATLAQRGLMAADEHGFEAAGQRAASSTTCRSASGARAGTILKSRPSASAVVRQRSAGLLRMRAGRQALVQPFGHAPRLAFPLEVRARCKSPPLGREHLGLGVAPQDEVHQRYFFVSAPAGTGAVVADTDRVPVRSQPPSVQAVMQMGHQGLVDHALAQFGVQHGPGHLDAAEHCGPSSRRWTGRALRRCLPHPSGNSTPANAPGSGPPPSAPPRFGLARQAGRQHAGAAHDQVHRGAGLGRLTRPSISSASVSALILMTTRAGSPRLAAAATWSRCSSMRLCMLKGATSSRRGCRNLPSAASWRNTESTSAVMSGSAVR